jgi:hypothetical protein
LVAKRRLAAASALLVLFSHLEFDGRELIHHILHFSNSFAHGCSKIGGPIGAQQQSTIHQQLQQADRSARQSTRARWKEEELC